MIMKKLFCIFFAFALSSICFAQGFSIPCDVVYPVESCKDSFILQKKTAFISDNSRTEVILTVKNLKEASDSSFEYINYGGSTSMGMSANDISVDINGKRVKTVKEDCIEGDKFVFKGHVPKGTFKIRYTINAGGSNIDGESYIEMFNYCIKNWNVSENYSEEISVSLHNDIISFVGENGNLKLDGKGKRNGKSFFLTSGAVIYTTKGTNGVEVLCRNYKRGYGGGSGAPTLLTYYTRDKKLHSAIDYIMQFITASRIVSNELSGDWNHEQYLELIDYLKLSTKDELRLFRNAFYAINGYVFKDSALNEYFDTAICYIPDNSVTQDSIKMKKEERILIEMIQAAEQGKSPEDVFNKYKK